jgi:hypothetical protein
VHNASANCVEAAENSALTKENPRARKCSVAAREEGGGARRGSDYGSGGAENPSENL